MILTEEQMKDDIFVFGSNRAGIHGSGAARYARMYKGAVYGVGEGITGRSYALPTKDKNIQTLKLSEIWIHVWNFLDYADKNEDLRFQVTAVGCGLAGYQPEQIAPMFQSAPLNCYMPPEWQDVVQLNSKNFWRYNE